MSFRFICNVCGKNVQCHYFPQQEEWGQCGTQRGHGSSVNSSTSKFDETDRFFTAILSDFFIHISPGKE
jgi:hypothetical protein